MSALQGYCELVNTTIDPVFTNTSNDDFVFYTTSSNQSIHFGTLSGGVAPSVLRLGQSNMYVNGDINLTRKVAMNGVIVRPRATAGVTQNITATVTNVPALASLTSNVTLSLTVPQSNFRFVNSSAIEVVNITQAGQIMTASNDSSNAPAYTWSGDSNTGMYHASNGQIGFSCGGSNVMTLSNNQIRINASNGLRFADSSTQTTSYRNAPCICSYYQYLPTTAGSAILIVPSSTYTVSMLAPNCIMTVMSGSAISGSVMCKVVMNSWNTSVAGQVSFWVAHYDGVYSKATQVVLVDTVNGITAYNPNAINYPSNVIISNQWTTSGGIPSGSTTSTPGTNGYGISTIQITL